MIKIKIRVNKSTAQLKKENEELKEENEELKKRLIDAQNKLNNFEDYYHYEVMYPDHVKCEECDCCVDCECCECEVIDGDSEKIEME